MGKKGEGWEGYFICPMSCFGFEVIDQFGLKPSGKLSKSHAILPPVPSLSLVSYCSAIIMRYNT